MYPKDWKNLADRLKPSEPAAPSSNDKEQIEQLQGKVEEWSVFYKGKKASHADIRVVGDDDGYTEGERERNMHGGLATERQ
eukprot:743672-Karenia_brevis.AAC.1